jgi:glycosyltransferase involved in cell wall biosynthesis
MIMACPWAGPRFGPGWTGARPLLQDRRVEQKVPLCLDGRMLAAEATGVATYARTARAALERVGAPPLILDDATRGRFGRGEGRAKRLRRWLAAGGSAPLRLGREPDGFYARDVFALAQARFGRTGEMLVLRAPGPPGVVHWTYPVAARIEGWRNLYTIHDVIPLTDPALTHSDAAGLRARLAAVLAHADAIVTVSEHSRAEIVRTLGIPAERVRNAGLAVEFGQLTSRSLPAGLTADSYYLFHGMAEPRKNLPRLAAAWRASGAPTPLVIAGPEGGEAIDVPGVIRLPYLPREDLVALIAGARALLFPSLAEGFGLPVAEAMALGTPVLTASGGALEETAGGAALLAEPTDIGAIAAAIVRLERDEALRSYLRAAGLARAQGAFGVEAFGRRLLEAYAEVVGDPRVLA